MLPAILVAALLFLLALLAILVLVLTVLLQSRFSDDGGFIVYKEGVLPAHTNSRLDAKRSPERRHHGRHGGSSTTTLEALGLQPPTDWYLKQQPAANVEQAADAADHEDNRFGPVGDLKAAHKVILRCDKLG